MPLFSHYGDIPDISDRLAIPSLVFAIVTPLVVIARLASRQSLAKHIGADDWTILASLILAETVSIQMIIGTEGSQLCEWGFGKHTQQVPGPLVEKTLKLYFSAQILYKINICLTKVSILLLYLRVFVQRWFQILCLTIIGIVIAFTVGSVFSSIFQCIPVQYAFNTKIPGGGHCINLMAFWQANAAFNITSDIVIICIPAAVINTLQLPNRSKAALCAVFALGFFVCVTSILRITTLNIATAHTDTMWQYINSSTWTVIESNLGIICASMPALKRPLSIVFPSLFAHVKSTMTGGRRTPSKSATYGNDTFGSTTFNSVSNNSERHGGGWLKSPGEGGSDDTYVLEEVAGDIRGSQDRLLQKKKAATLEDHEVGFAPSGPSGEDRANTGITKTMECKVEYEKPGPKHEMEEHGVKRLSDYLDRNGRLRYTNQ